MKINIVQFAFGRGQFEQLLQIEKNEINQITLLFPKVIPKNFPEVWVEGKIFVTSPFINISTNYDNLQKLLSKIKERFSEFHYQEFLSKDNYQFYATNSFIGSDMKETIEVIGILETLSLKHERVVAIPEKEVEKQLEYYRISGKEYRKVG